MKKFEEKQKKKKAFVLYMNIKVYINIFLTANKEDLITASTIIQVFDHLL